MGAVYSASPQFTLLVDDHTSLSLLESPHLGLFRHLRTKSSRKNIELAPYIVIQATFSAPQRSTFSFPAKDIFVSRQRDLRPFPRSQLQKVMFFELVRSSTIRVNQIRVRIRTFLELDFRPIFSKSKSMLQLSPKLAPDYGL